ncbi:cysteine-rich CWC family protein [Halopseudomonas salina]|uniref:Cysteine-rich CWC n=1 Tax=Halopseudomonas salina TaxID=1323744 RepID=A0ABQ1Q0B5_9GAMM|nr:cysteine-rich CWC family protein [Halopseudomonas salina]GGD09252.1 hypothetical protein GCM10007418_30400 [Halopseudomonas salina]
MKTTSRLVCPLCGQANQCAYVASDVTVKCWCFAVPVSKQNLARVPADQIDKACLCPRCATAGANTAEADHSVRRAD